MQTAERPEFEDLIGTNLRAPLFLAQAAAPELRRRRGLILNMVDIHGMKPLKNYPVYSSAKAALIMLTIRSDCCTRTLRPLMSVTCRIGFVPM